MAGSVLCSSHAARVSGRAAGAQTPGEGAAPSGMLAVLTEPPREGDPGRSVGRGASAPNRSWNYLRHSGNTVLFVPAQTLTT